MLLAFLSLRRAYFCNVSTQLLHCVMFVCCRPIILVLVISVISFFCFFFFFFVFLGFSDCSSPSCLIFFLLIGLIF